ncbi:copper amine oxidase N-terminal domain-containing protein [Paenibacillus sp. MMS20-IR301]|uniref:copper amine oxidase N-terminal domain-containing protein n=1 Tax=Paenibacillus sp. MMS20-IR301 TaxID=2895946 RepID=UPI0028EA7BCF|nr:copper amine oxidase N-terminal domain-containing protein [Paenibacillus sp. MMS20-IR301]WNS43522.1 copper amine oxidase N-terminal domain-containing protein [Paenibacillus sp. MMS20-IR301]
MIMFKLKIPAAALLTVALISSAPLTASAPISAAAASTTSVKVSNAIKVQNIDVKMLFDGVAMQPPAGQHVFMYNNTTYVPLRFMSYALQKSVSWDAKNLKVTVAEPTNSELVIIKEYLMNATTNSSFTAKNISLNNVNASYVFNEKAAVLPQGQSSYLLNGSLYVPLRFLSESVGNSISWNQKTKTITANSPGFEDSTAGNTNNNSGNTSASATPKPTATATTAPSGATDLGASGGSSGKVSYESITNATKAKLDALQSESQSTLMGIALEYVNAKDATTKQSIKARGVQQLNSFKASFNSIIADTEQTLNSNGYSTTIIQQYRAVFEAQLLAGQAIAEGMAN